MIVETCAETQVQGESATRGVGLCAPGRNCISNCTFCTVNVTDLESGEPMGAGAILSVSAASLDTVEASDLETWVVEQADFGLSILATVWDCSGASDGPPVPASTSSSEMCKLVAVAACFSVIAAAATVAAATAMAFSRSSDSFAG